MTSPVVGPFDKVQLWEDPTSFGWLNPSGYKYKRWYRQQRPYDLPLEFDMVSHQISDQLDSWFSPVPYSSAPSPDGSLTEDVHNKAFSKFVEKLKADQASLSVNLAERRQAVDMMSNRLFKLAEAARLVRKLRFGDAATALGLARAPFEGKTWKRLPKAFGDHWLEYHFGWEPLVKDIGAAIDILQGGVPSYIVSGKSRLQRLSTTRADTGDTRVVHSFSHDVRSLVQAEVSVTNANLALANQMGFVNPAVVVWELVPFSFVVDWFVNVSDFLGSFTDTLGFDILKSFHTDFQIVTDQAQFLYKDPLFPEKGYVTYQSYTGRTVVQTRRLGLGGVTLKVRPWKPVSLSRGLTAISLLLQQLRN